MDPISKPSLSQIREIRGALSGVIGMLALFSVVFFSGFGALGTAFFHHQESAFFRTALPADAKIEEIREGVRRSTRTQNGRTVTVTRTYYSGRILFTDEGGIERRAIVSLGEETPLEAGDVIPIAYQPDDPRSVRRAEMSGNAAMLKTVSQIFGAVFLVSLTALILLQRRRGNSQGPSIP